MKKNCFLKMQLIIFRKIHLCSVRQITKKNVQLSNKNICIYIKSILQILLTLKKLLNIMGKKFRKMWDQISNEIKLLFPVLFSLISQFYRFSFSKIHIKRKYWREIEKNTYIWHTFNKNFIIIIICLFITSSEGIF